jgi:hypothetical protein
MKSDLDIKASNAIKDAADCVHAVAWMYGDATEMAERVLGVEMQYIRDYATDVLAHEPSAFDDETKSLIDICNRVESLRVEMSSYYFDYEDQEECKRVDVMVDGLRKAVDAFKATSHGGESVRSDSAETARRWFDWGEDGIRKALCEYLRGDDVQKMLADKMIGAIKRELGYEPVEENS